MPCKSASPTISASPARCSPPAQTINIPHAYADLRFNPAFDKKTGYLHPLDPVRAGGQQGGQGDRRHPGAEQARRPVHRGGESRLKAFTAQVAIALREREAVRRRPEDEELQREHAAKACPTASSPLNEDGQIVTCNTAGYRIMQARHDGHHRPRPAPNSSPAPMPGSPSKSQEVGRQGDLRHADGRGDGIRRPESVASTSPSSR